VRNTYGPFIIYLLIYLSINCIFCNPVTGLEQRHETLSNPISAFAEAFKVDRTSVKKIESIKFATSSEQPLSEILLGIYNKDGRLYTGLVTVYGINNKTDFGEPLQLVIGDQFEAIDIVDLMGNPREVSLASSITTNQQGNIKLSDFKSPALLLRVGRNMAQRKDILILSTMNRSPFILWEETIGMINHDGGGYRTISMKLYKDINEFLNIELVQTTLPRKGASQFRPGPPLSLKYEMRDKSYKRIEHEQKK
jgi:hypothetical protein